MSEPREQPDTAPRRTRAVLTPEEISARDTAAEADTRVLRDDGVAKDRPEDAQPAEAAASQPASTRLRVKDKAPVTAALQDLGAAAAGPAARKEG